MITNYRVYIVTYTSSPFPHSEIYPFMVVIFGLENILIIVKAVMSTPVEFDVKNRIATGLSIQGGHITRNVITLVVMLTVGIAIFNYTMKVLVYIHLLTPSHPHTLTPHPPTHRSSVSLLWWGCCVTGFFS